MSLFLLFNAFGLEFCLSDFNIVTFAFYLFDLLFTLCPSLYFLPFFWYYCMLDAGSETSSHLLSVISTVYQIIPALFLGTW